MGNRVALWHVQDTVRTQNVLTHQGSSIDDIFLVGYELRTGGMVNLGIQNTVAVYRSRWPNIRWWLTIQCFSATAWKAMATPGDPLRTAVLAQMETIYDAYPWIVGIDLDAEGFFSNITTAEVMEGYKAFGDHARSFGKKVSAALPSVTYGNYSIGGETWVDYGLFGAYFDHVAIMTYDFAWSGSAPGPSAPRSWIQDVYDWAITQIPPEKILMGVPAYGIGWRIDKSLKDLGTTYRGNTGAYYWFWLHATGQISIDEDNQVPASWLTYRDIETNSPFMMEFVYWWSLASHVADSSGMPSLIYGRKPYLTRYGKSAASTVGELADQRVGSEFMQYNVRPMQVIRADGQWYNPDVHNLTIEVLQRVPQSATIMDDDCANTNSINIYYTKTGTWTHWRQGDPDVNPRTPGQFRTTAAARLALTALNGGGEYHVMGRFQFPGASGRAGVYCGSFEATVNTGGSLTLARNGTTLATYSVTAPGANQTTPFSGRCVVALRVRGNRARVYYGLTEENLSLVGTYVDSSYTAGPSGMIVTTGPVWYDHVRWGDAWWYNPQEAIDIQVGNQTFRDIGRIPRTNVTWDSFNRFRVNTDVEESETRDQSISRDWEFIHALGVGIPAGQTRAVKIIPKDINVWIATAYLCDPLGARIYHFSDAEYMAHSRDLAHTEWGLAGIAVWSLGQEDTRFWERVKGAELNPATRTAIFG